MDINCTLRTLMVHGALYKKSSATQMNSISAQMVSCMHQKFNSSLNSSIESVGFLYTTFLHLFYGMVKKLHG